jgi:hypothetical protein
MLADDVILVIDQAAPTPMIRSPRLDMRLAVQMRRNVACCKGEKIPSREDLRKLFKVPDMFAILPPRRMLAGVARLRSCPLGWRQRPIFGGHNALGPLTGDGVVRRLGRSVISQFIEDDEVEGRLGGGHAALRRRVRSLPDARSSRRP